MEMSSRREVVYFGVDEYDDPLLTCKIKQRSIVIINLQIIKDYHCVDGGNCTEIYNMTCSRTCDEKTFDFNRANFALLQV